MKIKQLSIFLENKEGRLAEVTKLLYNNDINIRSLSLADTEDFGVLRLIVDDSDKAHKILKSANIISKETEVIAVEVEDNPGGLYSILNLFDENGINVEYMYAFVQRKDQNAIMIFKIDAADKAIKLMNDNNLKLVTKEMIQSL